MLFSLKDADWVVDSLESMEYHGHACHVKVVNLGVFQIPLEVKRGITTSYGEFLVGEGDAHYLYGYYDIELCNNV